MVAYRVLDIETVPDHEAHPPGASKPKFSLRALGPMQPMPGVPVRPEDISFVAPAGVELDEPFLPPLAHRVTAVSWVNMLGGDGSRYHYGGHFSKCLYSEDGLFERSLLSEFSTAEKADDAMLITWNGRTFDLPVLSLRSLKHGVPFDFYYTDTDMRYRYSQAGHIDLMDYLSDYGASRFLSLDDMARLIGLPGKAGQLGGRNVDALLRESSRSADLDAATAKVARYCLSDSLQTALIFLRTRVHLGKIGPEEHDTALLTFEESDVATKAGLDVDWSKLRMIGRNT